MTRRDHRGAGLALVASAVVVVVILAISVSWRPALGLIAIVGLFGGLEIDRPGDPKRRALGLLGVAVGLFALIIAAFYV